jgi:hypothetical protein
MLYREQFGNRSLTKSQLEKMKELEKHLATLPDE